MTGVGVTARPPARPSVGDGLSWVEGNAVIGAAGAEAEGDARRGARAGGGRGALESGWAAAWEMGEFPK